MRNRAAAAPVVAFAVAVAAVAVLAARSGGGDRLVRLPAAFGASAGEDDAAATTMAAPAARSALMPAFKVEYEVEGTLPDLPATAPAYRLASDASAADVQALATALGLAGQPVADGEGWVVQDGSRALRVMRVPGLPWYLGEDCPEAPARADDGGDAAVAKCAVGVAVSGAGTAGSAGVATDLPADAPTLVAPAPPCAPGTCTAPTTSIPCKGDTVDCAPLPGPGATVVPVPAPDAPARPADMPSRDEAARLAREAFARLGVGDAGFAVEDGWLAWDARVETRVDGVAVVGQGTSVGIGPKGRIVRANGWLARPERIGGYPLVGVQAGLERLRSGFGAGPMAMAGGRLAGDQAVAVAPAPAPEPATTVPGTIEPAPPAEPPVTVEPPSPVLPVPREPQVMTVVVVGARLALVQVGDALVPAYVFELQGGGDTVPVPAVADEWLDQHATTLQKG